MEILPPILEPIPGISVAVSGIGEYAIHNACGTLIGRAWVADNIITLAIMKKHDFKADRFVYDIRDPKSIDKIIATISEARTNSMNRLLILSCSQTKRPMRGPAIDVYDGVQYRTLRRALDVITPTLRQRTYVEIVSAMHGLIRSDYVIDGAYDLRMTTSRIDGLRHCVMSDLRQSMPSPLSFENVYISMGKDYLPALDGIEEQFHNAMAVEYNKGGIGTRLKNLKQWLLTNTATT